MGEVGAQRSAPLRLTGAVLPPVDRKARMRILELNVHDPEYPRNARIRQYLQQQGYDVVVDRRNESPNYLLNVARVIRRGVTAKGPFDVVLLSELSVQYAVAGWVVALRHRATYVADSFVGMYESNVEDWQIASGGSIKGRLYSLFDTLSSRLPKANLIDTDARAAQLGKRARGPVFTLPVGAPDWVIHQLSVRSASDPLRVLYYGNYIPLHGLPFVLSELAQTDPGQLQVTFVGQGEARPAAEALARQLGVHEQIQWVGHVEPNRLGSIIAEHDVVLGVFGESPKATSVIANKVWQGLYAGKTVITRASPALDEVRDIVTTQLIEVDPQETGSLRNALLLLARDVSVRHDDAREKLRDYVELRFASFGAWLEDRR